MSEVREKKKSSSKQKDGDKSQGSVKSKKVKEPKETKEVQPVVNSHADISNHDHEKSEKHEKYEVPVFHFPEQQKLAPSSSMDLTMQHQQQSQHQQQQPQYQPQQSQLQQNNHQQNQQQQPQHHPTQLNPLAAPKFMSQVLQPDHLEQVSFMRKDDGPKACMHHGQAFAFFCATCEEPICQQCTVLGPHNNQLHRINRMNDAFKQRTTKISEQIKVNLISKREQLLAQIHRVSLFKYCKIEYRIEEIQYVKTIIERDARAEYSSILERLRSGEGGKLALLHHEIAEIQKDLDQINDVGSMYYDLSASEDPCPFLMRSRQIYENIEYLVSKPFKVNIDIYPYDLPRELTELRLQLQKALAQKQLLDFKNEIIWKVMSDKKKDEDTLKYPLNKIRSELERQAADEITEWSRLVDKFSLELKRYHMVCYFCACPMDKDNVNRKCGVNGPDSEINKVYTQEQPPSDCVGNERHFFSKPFGE